MADNDAHGLTIRELLLEIRNDVKELDAKVDVKVDRKEVYSVMAFAVTVGVGLIAVVL